MSPNNLLRVNYILHYFHNSIFSYSNLTKYLFASRLTLYFNKYEIRNFTSYEEIKIIDSKFSTFGLD